MAIVIDSATGEIDLDQTTPGTYVVTYTVQGVSYTQEVTVNAVDDATFSYSSNSYTPSSPNPTPTISGATGGTFSSTTGLVFVDSGTNTGSSTGEINLSSSTPNSYVITYNTPSSNPCPSSSTFSLVINYPYQIEVEIPEGDLVFPIYGNTSNGALYDYTVDWGDGTSNSYSGSTGRSISKTYPSAGTYQISITGNAWPGATWSASQNKLNRITKLLSWGNTGLNDLANAFSGSTALVQATPPDTIKWNSNATPSLYRCFYNCVNLTTASIAGTDTSVKNGIYGREMFRSCTSLETLNIQNVTFDNDVSSNAAYGVMYNIGTNTTDGTEINFSNINFVKSTSTHALSLSSLWRQSRIKSLIADNWDFSGYSGIINLQYLLYLSLFPTANKTAYFRNWTFNASNSLDMNYFHQQASLDEIDFSGNTEIMYVYGAYDFSYNSQVQRIKGLNKFKSATTVSSTGLQRMFRNATHMTFLTTDSQYNFRDDFVHSGSNADKLNLFMAYCGNSANVSGVNSIPNMGNWGTDNITSFNSAFRNSRFSEYPTLYWNLSSVSDYTYAFYQAQPKGTSYTKDIDFRNCTFPASSSSINTSWGYTFYQCYFQNIYFSSSQELPRNNKLQRTFAYLTNTNIESINLDNWDYGNIGTGSEDLYPLQGYIGTIGSTHYGEILARIRATAPTSVNSSMTFGNSRLEAEALHTSQQAGSGWNTTGNTVINQTGVGVGVSVGDIFYQSNQAQSSRYYYRITAVGSEDQITISSGLLYTGNYWNILTSQAIKDRQYIVENLATGFTDGKPIL